MTTFLKKAVGLISVVPLCLSIQAQDTLFFEGYETTSYQNLIYSTPPCSNLPDLWDTISNLNGTIPPSSSYFWGVRDLNGNCGGSLFETIQTDTFDLSNHNFSFFSFDYFYFELDNGDEMKYQITYNLIPQTEVILINGSNNISSNGWLTESIHIPDSVSSFSISISFKQNGDNDYLGLDNLCLTGIHKDSCFIHAPTLSALTCNNHGSNSNALDDYFDFTLLCEGQNTTTFNIYQNDSLLQQNLDFQLPQSLSSISGSTFNINHFEIRDSANTHCFTEFSLDSSAHCSTNYQISLNLLSTTNLNSSCNQGDSILISLNSIGNFDSTNYFEIILYDSTQNNFSSLLTTLATNTLDTQLYLSTPHALVTSNTYQLSIKSSYPYLTTTSTTLNINNPQNCISPYLTGILINACSSGMNEGSGELIFGYTGSYTINTSADFKFYYAANLPFSSSHLKIDSFTHEPVNTLLLNSAAGCPNLFIDAYQQIIPSNSRFMICRNDVDINSVYWYNLCGHGPIYVLYAEPTNWLDNGLFSNLTTTGIRYMKASFTDTFAHVYTNEIAYDRTLNSGLDGDFTSYQAPGGFPSQYQNFGCYLTPGILPIHLLDFQLHKQNENIQIDFSFADQSHFKLYHLEKYIDDVWREIKNFKVNDNYPYYTYVDELPLSANNYRLLATNDQGKIELLGGESIAFEQNDKKIIARTNLLGQSINASTKGWQIILYEDYSTQKVYNP